MVRSSSMRKGRKVLLMSHSTKWDKWTNDTIIHLDLIKTTTMMVTWTAKINYKSGNGVEVLPTSPLLSSPLTLTVSPLLRWGKLHFRHVVTWSIETGFSGGRHVSRWRGCGSRKWFRITACSEWVKDLSGFVHIKLLFFNF